MTTDNELIFNNNRYSYCDIDDLPRPWTQARFGYLILHVNIRSYNRNSTECLIVNIVGVHLRSNYTVKNISVVSTEISGNLLPGLGCWNNGSVLY